MVVTVVSLAMCNSISSLSKQAIELRGMIWLHAYDRIHYYEDQRV